MSDFLRSYPTVGIFGLVGVALVGVFLGLGKILRPNKPTLAKTEPMSPVSSRPATCGPRPTSGTTFPGCAMFDVEAVFIFPWATRLRPTEPSA